MEVVNVWPEPRMGRFWAVGWQWAEQQFGQQSFVLEHMSPGTGMLLSCSPRHWCCFYFLCSFILCALLQRGQVPSSPSAQGKLQQLCLAVPLHRGTRQIQQWHHTAASPSPRSMFTFSWLYFGLNYFWCYALLILKCWILKSRLH